MVQPAVRADWLIRPEAGPQPCFGKQFSANLFLLSNDLVDSLLGDAIVPGQLNQAFTQRIASPDFLIAVALFLCAIGTKGCGQGQALVEPRQDAVDSL